MDVLAEDRGDCLILKPVGRLDTTGSNQLAETFRAECHEPHSGVIVDMSEVAYLSSAGLRVVLTMHKALRARHGTVVLVGANPFCRQVLEMTGMAHAFPQCPSLEQALALCERAARERFALEHWEDLERWQAECGSFRLLVSCPDRTVVRVLGRVKDVLCAAAGPAQLHSKRFSETEYSIGLGGLGDRLQDYFPVMGEMITIGGTMVWLPTDGHDTPDFLIPQVDTGGVTLRTVFNVSLAGQFNEVMLFESCEEKGTSLTTLYRTLFQFARGSRPAFRGVLGLALRGEMGAVYGSGVTRSPIKDLAPANGEMITDPSNFAEWFEVDTTPRYQQVTGLLCGVGVDLTSDLSSFDQAIFNDVFYLHPANIGGKTELLHTHGVFFSPLPMPERTASLEEEIKRVVEEGDFMDMRHLLDKCTVTSAVLGVCYIQEFERDADLAGS